MHKSIINTEWCANIFYKIEGKFPELKITVVDLFLMDIGTSAYTEADCSEDLIEVYEKNPEYMELKLGFMHTHHHMEAYFSSTDEDQLVEALDFYENFLSVIVNYSGNYVARISMMATSKIEETITYPAFGEEKSFTNQVQEEYPIYVDCEMVKEQEADTPYSKELQERMQELKKRETTKNSFSSGAGYFHKNKDDYNPWWDEEDYFPTSQTKDPYQDKAEDVIKCIFTGSKYTFSSDLEEMFKTRVKWDKVKAKFIDMKQDEFEDSLDAIMRSCGVLDWERDFVEESIMLTLEEYVNINENIQLILNFLTLVK